MEEPRHVSFGWWRYLWSDRGGGGRLCRRGSGRGCRRRREVSRRGWREWWRGCWKLRWKGRKREGGGGKINRAYYKMVRNNVNDPCFCFLFLFSILCFLSPLRSLCFLCKSMTLYVYIYMCVYLEQQKEFNAKDI